MAKVVHQEVKFCKNCDKQTLHLRNGKEIKWVMHLVLTILTAGLWLIPFLIMFFWRMLTAPIPGTGGGNKGWVCSGCGK